MKTIFKAILAFIKLHKIWSVIIGLIILGGLWYMLAGNKKAVNTDFAVTEIGSIREVVSVTGNVKPLASVDLAFERGGRVAVIDVAVGDKVLVGENLAAVSNADLLANVDQAKANLKKMQASVGTGADRTALSLAQAKDLLVNTIKDSYTKADDAVRNKMYSLFADPFRYNAHLLFNTDSSLRDDIETGRNTLSDSLDSWSQSLTSLSDTSDLDTPSVLAQNNLNSIKLILDKCASAVNALDSISDGIPQAQIDTWKLNISTARTETSAAIDALTASINQLKTANLSSKISGSDTLAEEAGIEAAQAAVASAEAELAKSMIVSPISGVVTDVPIKLGEIVPVNQPAISVISYGDYEIEAFVPEADIAKVKIGNLASTTLDAYGSGINFDTQVIKIDPAATVIDGVPTYKVTLKFVNQDDRVRSGMTANLDILTAQKENVLSIPARTVYTKDDGKYVRVLDAKGVPQEVKVEVGLRGVDGMDEIVSGLKVGDKVSTVIKL